MPRGGCHWIKRAPKDRFMRTVLSTQIMPRCNGGQLIVRGLECGHNHYTSHGNPDMTRTYVRCRVCIAAELNDHAARSRRPTQAERLIDDYVAGRASGSVMDVARAVMAIEAGS